VRINKIRKRRFIITLIMLFILGVTFFSLGFKDTKDIRYSYKENNSVDYKVYLKDNNFFESSYLEKNKTYITSLIDYITADYTYNVTFNNKVSGDLNYKVVAEIKADKANNDVGNYWTKTYDLTSYETDSVTSVSSHVINVSQKNWL